MITSMHRSALRGVPAPHQIAPSTSARVQRVLRRNLSSPTSGSWSQQRLPRSRSAATLNAPVDTAVPVTVVIKKQVAFGDRLAVVGASSELGCWSAASAVLLTWSPGDVWSADLQLAPGTHHFKCLAIRASGRIEWEHGDNRVIEVPSQPSAALTALCQWCDTRSTALDIVAPSMDQLQLPGVDGAALLSAQQAAMAASAAAASAVVKPNRLGAHPSSSAAAAAAGATHEEWWLATLPGPPSLASISTSNGGAAPLPPASSASTAPTSAACSTSERSSLELEGPQDSILTVASFPPSSGSGMPGPAPAVAAAPTDLGDTVSTSSSEDVSAAADVAAAAAAASAITGMRASSSNGSWLFESAADDEDSMDTAALGVQLDSTQDEVAAAAADASTEGGPRPAQSSPARGVSPYTVIPVRSSPSSAQRSQAASKQGAAPPIAAAVSALDATLLDDKQATSTCSITSSPGPPSSDAGDLASAATLPLNLGGFGGAGAGGSSVAGAGLDAATSRGVSDLDDMLGSPGALLQGTAGASPGQEQELLAAGVPLDRSSSSDGADEGALPPVLLVTRDMTLSSEDGQQDMVITTTEMLLDAHTEDAAAQQQQGQPSAATSAAALLDRLRAARGLDVGGPVSAYPSQGDQQQLQLGPRTPSSASPTGSSSISAESASAAAALASAALGLLDDMEEEEEQPPLRQRFTAYSSHPAKGQQGMLQPTEQSADPASAPPARRLQRLPALRLRTDGGSATDGSLPGGGHSLAPVLEPEGVEEEGCSCDGLAAPPAAAGSAASSPGQQLPTPAAAGAPVPRPPSAAPSLYDEIEEIEARLAAAEAKLVKEQQELWGLTDDKEADTFPPQLHVRVTPRVTPEAPPPPPAPVSPSQPADSATGSGSSTSSNLAATTGLVLVSGAHAIPHVAKVHTGGEDAFFISTAGHGAIGVADGVSAWAEDGIDPGDYSRTLAAHAAEAWEMRVAVRSAQTAAPTSGSHTAAGGPCGAHTGRPPSTTSSSSSEATRRHESAGLAARGGKGVARGLDPRGLLRHAQMHTYKPGSATMVLAALEPSGLLHIANLGDCGVKVVRRGQVILSTEPQQHEFNLPYQMSHPRLFPETDIADSADRYTLAVQPGDIIVAASDGLFDNLWDAEMLDLLLEAATGRPCPSPGAGGPPKVKRSNSFSKLAAMGKSGWKAALRRVGSGGNMAETLGTATTSAASASSSSVTTAALAPAALSKGLVFSPKEFAERAARLLAQRAAQHAADKDFKSPWSVAAGQVYGLMAKLFAKGGKMDDVTCVVACVMGLDGGDGPVGGQDAADLGRSKSS